MKKKVIFGAMTSLALGLALPLTVSLAEDSSSSTDATSSSSSLALEGADTINADQSVTLKVTDNQELVIKAIASHLKLLPKALSDSDKDSLKSQLEAASQSLSQDGWSYISIADGFIDGLSKKGDLASLQKDLSDQLSQTKRFGSSSFQNMWYAQVYQVLGEKEAQQLLTVSYQNMALPNNLSGDNQETARLVASFSDDLEPASDFWDSFSEVVKKAFPKRSLSKKTSLARMTHQFRYVISAQQAQWVRTNYGKDGETDKQALARYLATKDEKNSVSEALGIDGYDYDVTYDLGESSRLHNKVSVQLGQFGDGVVVYPNYTMSTNIKIVMDFHTEFILNSQGEFLNEVDPEGASETGIINGASFNYASANDAAHIRLDVKPVGPNDPTFRIEANRQTYTYKSPNKLKYSWQESDKLQWANSYYNKEGYYSQKGKSAASLVKSSANSFKKMIEGYRK
ncbi:DUF3114 domain-containing protein [Streptococcus loxodontisalivarius]|uniref:DUF3114 domain-containing protein n=1 Tax=Streptococcus loxodontisalivarius TaxID=1349415 RepID=A0ABS2PQN1_9STRE|nr:DUF3114 domain-containing protein [Streptococcus loxodontisalivarius]MBM7642348.1 hypothetical protein [Streptococcus loxodontisalivarius]